jgi:hypothetical protein
MRFSRASQPVDILVNCVDPETALGFVNTCQDVANFVVESDPDLWVFPNRGAGPMMHVMLGAESVTPDQCFEPAVGTALNNGSSRKGINTTSKKQVFAEAINPGMHVALIDESQVGGSIRKHHAIVAKITGEPVITCQVQDQRVTPQFSLEDTYADIGVHRLFIGPVFHIDRSALLDEIVETDQGRVVNRNEIAANIFHVLGSTTLGTPLDVDVLVGNQVPVSEPDCIRYWVDGYNHHLMP